jgi:hypothetical protein
VPSVFSPKKSARRGWLPVQFANKLLADTVVPYTFSDWMLLFWATWDAPCRLNPGDALCTGSFLYPQTCLHSKALTSLTRKYSSFQTGNE